MVCPEPCITIPVSTKDFLSLDTERKELLNNWANLLMAPVLLLPMSFLAFSRAIACNLAATTAAI